MVMFVIVLLPGTRTQCRHLYNFGGDFVYANSGNSPKNQYICDKMAIDLMISSLIIYLIVIASLFLAVCVPLYKIFLTDEVEWIIPVILPFVDPDSQNGLYLNLTNQLISAAFGVIIVPATELITCVLKNNCLATAAVIENTIIELQNLLQNDKTFSNERIWQFRNIILKTMDHERFVENYKCTLYLD